MSIGASLGASRIRANQCEETDGNRAKSRKHCSLGQEIVPRASCEGASVDYLAPTDLRCGGPVWHRSQSPLIERLVAGNQVLATKLAAFSKHLRSLVQRRIRLSARLRLRKRINHLQWGGVVTNQLLRLAPQRIDVFRGDEVA